MKQNFRSKRLSIQDGKLKNTALSKLSTVQLIVLFYLTAVAISTILLSLPIAHNPGVELRFIDALFTAVSAISVTGLTVVNTADTFSIPGYFILMFVFQFGGIGIMSLGTFVWLIMGRKIGLKERKLIMTDQNRSTLSGLVKLMKEILALIIIIELIGAVILGIYFMKYFPTWHEAFLHGLFSSVSATTNAGFDITGTSMIVFANDFFVQFITIILIILGAIGFPVLIEVKEFILHKGEYPYRFSLFTKLTSVTFFSLVIIGTMLIYVFEYKHFFIDKTWYESFFYSLFQSTSTRSGGLATMDVSEFSTHTQLLMSFLMFVGASPSSVGGGIRTTTFAIAILSVVFYARGKDSIKVFNREIDPNDILRSFIVIFTAFIIVGFSIIVLRLIEPPFSLIAIVFEVCSAFGTTGLSMGITPDLSTPGKILIMILMFVGRIGLFSFLFIIRGRSTGDKYQLPRERVIIG